MRDYLGNAEATAAAFPEGQHEDGGWLRSGDAGYVRDGYFYLCDRVKDMIISGGGLVRAGDAGGTTRGPGQT